VSALRGTPWQKRQVVHFQQRSESARTACGRWNPTAHLRASGRGDEVTCAKCRDTVLFNRAFGVPQGKDLADYLRGVIRDIHTGEMHCLARAAAGLTKLADRLEET
jgi:hypothetical protein